MQITDIKIRKLFIKEESSKVRAIVSVTFDEAFAVHDIKIIDGAERWFIAMPNRRSEDGRFQDIVHPITSEFRATMEEVIIKAYYDALNALGRTASEPDTVRDAVQNQNNDSPKISA